MGGLPIYKKHQRLRFIYSNGQDRMMFQISRLKPSFLSKSHSAINALIRMSSQKDVPSLHAYVIKVELLDLLLEDPKCLTSVSRVGGY